MTPNDDLSQPATKGDVARLETKMDEILEMKVDIRWLKGGLSGAYAAVLALFTMK